MGNKVLGKCPVCEGNIIENEKGYGCCNWKDKNCKFIIWKNFYDKQITPSQAKALLDKGKTTKVKGWVSRKTGKEFEAALKLEKTDDGYRVFFDF